MKTVFALLILMAVTVALPAQSQTATNANSVASVVYNSNAPKVTENQLNLFPLRWREVTKWLSAAGLDAKDIKYTTASYYNITTGAQDKYNVGVILKDKAIQFVLFEDGAFIHNKGLNSEGYLWSGGTKTEKGCYDVFLQYANGAKKGYVFFSPADFE